MARRQPSDIRTALLGVLRAGVYAVPFLPLLVTESLLFPHVTGRNLAFRVLTEVLLVPLAALWWISKRDRPRLSPLAIALLVFVAIVAVADVLGVDAYKSFWSTYQRMAGLLGLIHAALFFFILRTAFDTRDAWMRYFAVSIAASALVGLMALVEFAVFQGAGVAGRTAGTIGNAGVLGGYALLHVFLCLLVVASRRYPKMRGVLIGSLCLDLLLVYMSGTRAALLALFVAAPVAAVAWRDWRLCRHVAASGRWRVAAVLAAGVVVALLVMQGASLRENFSREGAGTGAVRLVTWSTAWQAVQERVWTGWGQENFPIARDRHYASTAGEATFDRAHNVILDWLIVGGIPALAAYVALLFVFVRRIWSIAGYDMRTAAALGGLVTAHIVFSLFWFETLETQLIFTGVMAFADGTAGRASAHETTADSAARWSPGAAFATALVALTALAAVYTLNVRPMLLAKDVVVAVTGWADNRNVAASRTNFERAFAYRGLRSQEAIELMALHVPQVIARRGQTEPGEVTAFADRAIRELIALTSSPIVEVKHLQLLGRTAGVASVLDPSYRRLAMDSFARALELSPANENTYSAFARFHAAAGDLTTALALQQKAMALAANAAGYRMEFVRLAVRAGVATQDDLEFAGRQIAADTNLLGRAAEFVEGGDVTLARMALDEMVRRDPGNVQLRAERDSIARRPQALGATLPDQR